MLDLNKPIKTRLELLTPESVGDRVAFERWVRQKVQVWGWDFHSPNFHFGLIPGEEQTRADMKAASSRLKFAQVLQDELLHFEDRKGNPRQPKAGTPEHGDSTYSVRMDRHHDICRALKSACADRKENTEAS